MLPRILQIRQDALVAKYLYRRELSALKVYQISLTTITVIVPILFIAAQWVTKGTNADPVMSYVSFVGSAMLICLTVYSLIFGLGGKIEDASNGLGNNIFIAEECQNFQTENAQDNELEWFFRYVSSQDSTDNKYLGDVPKKKRQAAYREALKELVPSTVTTCPVCGASPWKYVKGTCEACGNSNL